MTSQTTKPEQFLDVSLLHFTDEYNPNVQDDATFNALVETIQESGFTENIVVVDHSNNPDWQHPEQPYEVVSGNHRGKAAQVLGMETIPARVFDPEEWDDDFVKFQNVRHNALRGKMDPVKFTKMFMSLSQKYGEQATKDMMMFIDNDAFKRTLVQTKQGLPPEMRKQLEKSGKDIKTVDDLSNLLNKMFSSYGDTLAHDFMVFDYGGKQHVWVRMDEDLKKEMETIRAEVMTQRVSIAELFKRLIVEHGNEVIALLPNIDTPDFGDLS